MPSTEDKKMKINVKNTEKINIALDDMQSRARVRLTTAIDVSETIKIIEDRLIVLRVPKKAWVGIKITNRMLEQFPGAYKGHPESTHFTVERFSSGWFLTSTERDWCDLSGESLHFANQSEYQHLYKF